MLANDDSHGHGSGAQWKRYWESGEQGIEKSIGTATAMVEEQCLLRFAKSEKQQAPPIGSNLALHQD